MECPGVGDTAAALFWDQRSKSQSEPAPCICRAQRSGGVRWAQHKEVDTMVGWLLWPTALPQPLPQSGDNSNSSNNTMAAACNNAVTLFKETANQR